MFLADRRSLSIVEATAVSTNPVAAARCVDAESGDSDSDDAEVTQLLGRLSTHLGQPRAAELTRVVVRTESLTDGLYVFALAEAAAPTGSRLDLEVAGRSAQRVVKLRRRGSSLAAAVALWMAEMREALAARPPGVLRRIPKDRAELPEALSEAFTDAGPNCTHSSMTSALASRIELFGPSVFEAFTQSYFRPRSSRFRSEEAKRPSSIPWSSRSMPRMSPCDWETPPIPISRRAEHAGRV